MRSEDVSRHSATLYDIARNLIADRKMNPRPVDEDPASSLLSETVNGQPLDEEHLLGCLRQSLVVGMVVRFIVYIFNQMLTFSISGSAYITWKHLQAPL